MVQGTLSFSFCGIGFKVRVYSVMGYKKWFLCGVCCKAVPFDPSLSKETAKPSFVIIGAFSVTGAWTTIIVISLDHRVKHIYIGIILALKILIYLPIWHFLYLHRDDKHTGKHVLYPSHAWACTWKRTLQFYVTPDIIQKVTCPYHVTIYW
jgi:hypothetical protein